jgi:hypothetical protein
MKFEPGRPAQIARLALTLVSIGRLLARGYGR